MKVLVVASHSAGHIWPAVAFCQGLKEKDSTSEVNFVSSDGELEKKLLTGNSDKVHFFKKEKSRVLIMFALIGLVFRARSLIRELSPDLIVGFGGYLSLPFIVCARFLKIPNFIHEQNFTFGAANRFLAHIADKVIFSFPNPEISDKLKSKSIALGFPLRRDIKSIDKQKARRYFDLDIHRFTLLVMGGSQGSASINSLLLSVLKEEKRLSGIQVIHIAGAKDYQRVQQRYQDINIKHKVLPFSERMEFAWSACDLAVCRSGAGSIAEITALRVPAILIPYPYAKRHQLGNARFLSEKDAAILLEEGASCKEGLKQNIVDLVENHDSLIKLAEALKKVDLPDARNKMAEIAFELAVTKS